MPIMPPKPAKVEMRLTVYTLDYEKTLPLTCGCIKGNYPPGLTALTITHFGDKLIVETHNNYYKVSTNTTPSIEADLKITSSGETTVWVHDRNNFKVCSIKVTVDFNLPEEVFSKATQLLSSMQSYIRPINEVDHALACTGFDDKRLSIESSLEALNTHTKELNSRHQVLEEICKKLATTYTVMVPLLYAIQKQKYVLNPVPVVSVDTGSELPKDEVHHIVDSMEDGQKIIDQYKEQHQPHTFLTIQHEGQEKGKSQHYLHILMINEDFNICRNSDSSKNVVIRCDQNILVPFKYNSLSRTNAVRVSKDHITLPGSSYILVNGEKKPISKETIMTCVSGVTSIEVFSQSTMSTCKCSVHKPFAEAQQFSETLASQEGASSNTLEISEAQEQIPTVVAFGESSPRHRRIKYKRGRDFDFP